MFFYNMNKTNDWKNVKSGASSLSAMVQMDVLYIAVCW